MEAQPSESKMSSDSTITLEICTSSIQSVLNANAAGAHRIELCSNLEQGGITPSYGTIKHALLRSKIPIHVLVRPRAGNFVYSSDEIDIMVEDIKMCKQLNCHGIVVGVLTVANTVDISAMQELVKHADPLPVTFHRAFDDCEDKFQALEDVIACGCAGILTSGGCETAEEGISILKELVEIAADRIKIMPGAGVSPANVARIVESTGVKEIHASAKALLSSHERNIHSRFNADIWETDERVVKLLLKRLEIPSSRDES